MNPSLIESFQNMSLRKGDTFHTPSNIGKVDFWDPLESRTQSPPMPPRSGTCPRSLEDLLIGAGDRRTKDLFKRVDKAVETQSKLALAHILTEPEVLPVPTFMVRETTGQEGIRKSRTHSHGSDSGIGTSIAGSEESIPAKAPTGEWIPAYSRLTLMCHVASPSTPTQSFSDISTATEERGLSKYACEQIHKHIVQPILREQALKDFHPLIKDVPSKIGKKEIKNLRDLEKTLIFLAPVSSYCFREQSECTFTHGCFGVKDYSRSHIKYLQFCERTIRVLHTTVTTLHESDQRAPTERAYTQGYFFDLVEQVRFGRSDSIQTAIIDIIRQIRRYAQILAATREKKAKGEDTDEMDYSP
jgi:hypothetical protein